MRKYRAFLFIMLITFLVSGCDEEWTNHVVFTSPDCKVEIVNKTNSVLGQAVSLQLAASNSSTFFAYNVSCIAKLKKGNTIIEEGSCSFGTLRSGQSSFEAIIFTKIKSHNEYDKCELILSWDDQSKKHYEKKFE